MKMYIKGKYQVYCNSRTELNKLVQIDYSNEKVGLVLLTHFSKQFRVSGHF